MLGAASVLAILVESVVVGSAGNTSHETGSKALMRGVIIANVSWRLELARSRSSHSVADGARRITVFGRVAIVGEGAWVCNDGAAVHRLEVGRARKLVVLKVVTVSVDAGLGGIGVPATVMRAVASVVATTGLSANGSKLEHLLPLLVLSSGAAAAVILVGMRGGVIGAGAMGGGRLANARTLACEAGKVRRGVGTAGKARGGQSGRRGISAAGFVKRCSLHGAHS